MKERYNYVLPTNSAQEEETTFTCDPLLGAYLGGLGVGLAKESADISPGQQSAVD